MRNRFFGGVETRRRKQSGVANARERSSSRWRCKRGRGLARRATDHGELQLLRGFFVRLAERAAGKHQRLNKPESRSQVEPVHLAALIERAEIHLKNGANDLGRSDLAKAEPLIRGEKAIASRSQQLTILRARPDDAQRVAKSAGILNEPTGSSGRDKVIGTPEEIEAANSEEPEMARKALEALLVKNPKNAMLLARLGNAYRKTDPTRSLDYYRRQLRSNQRTLTMQPGIVPH